MNLTQNGHHDNSLKETGSQNGQALTIEPAPLPSNDGDLPCHEVANIYPPMTAEEFKALVEDIRQHGQLEPIMTHEGQVIDGRNRRFACKELGITPGMTCPLPPSGRVSLAVILKHNAQRSMEKVLRLLTGRRLPAVDAPRSGASFAKVATRSNGASTKRETK